MGHSWCQYLPIFLIYFLSCSANSAKYNMYYKSPICNNMRKKEPINKMHAALFLCLLRYKNGLIRKKWPPKLEKGLIYMKNLNQQT